MTDHKKIHIDKLHLDAKNPRLSEFGITNKSKEREILQILWDEMAVNELMYSIVSNGYWDYEPLIVIQEGGKYVTVEGNRRLAAIKIIRNPSLIEGNVPKHILDRINENVLSTIETIPVIEVTERKQAWKFVGFKHVNGPAKWGSFAKAKYIAEIHNDFQVPIEDIAYQIGDTNKTAQKLYQGLMVLEQADSSGTYKYDDIQANRIYFSHLYTGIQREGIRDYIKLSNIEEEAKSPVPKDKLKNLGELLEWLYGSKRNETQAVIRSQNPDLKYLDEVLKSKEGIYALKSGESLTYAYDLSRDSDSLFEENLLSTKRTLQKARAHSTTGYEGEENLLKVAGSVANLADDLYKEMEATYKKKLGKNGNTRMTE